MGRAFQVEPCGPAPALPARLPHRKKVKTYNGPGHAHLWTFSCYRRLPLLTNDLWRAWLSRSVDAALAQHHFHLVAFVFMRDHVHLIVHPLEAVYDMAVIKKAVKRPFAGRLKDHLVSVGSPLLKSLIIRERPGVVLFRVWQEGGGHDRNLWNRKALLEAIDYVHFNPVRRGLVRSPNLWRWSSWNYYNNPQWKGDPDLPTVHGLPPGW